ncbi:SEC2 [Candida metapsilosis]|uniref:SEC2 n=1 Tax=Candida metapsilosis TaxID=273372 RepID=A0A8H7ZFA4_9ASCO|nr:SEC2 [Candida metapsilosis]
MAEVENLDKRLEEEIGNLSTRLVTAVNRQVELEETVLQLRKTVSELESRNAILTKSDENYKVILPKYLKLQEDFKEVNIKKEVAENENGRLKDEVEDLSASLFDEANTMVSNASRETYNFKVKNKKLYEEIDEKNIIISNLQDQLQDLKQMFIKMEDKQRVMLSSSHNGTPNLEPKEFNFDNKSIEEDYQTQQLSNTLYAPLITSLRFDLNNYNKEFKGFIYTLIKPEFTLDLTHLKNLAFFKQIWIDEIENTAAHIPNLPSSTLLNRWQKNKVFWSSLIDGRVSIEPIKGYSEGSSKNANDKEVEPELLTIAIKDPCAFCGESRNKYLEHCRLHHYKIYDVDESLIACYPLCHFCVLKLRNLCDFFAKLRAIKSNVFKLKQTHMFDEYVNRATANSGSNFYKRTSSSSSSAVRSIASSPSATASASDSDLTNGHVFDLKLDDEEESKLIKIYLVLTQIRLKIYYSKLGLRENVNRLNELNIEEIHYEAFSSLIPDKEERDSSSGFDTVSRKSFDSTTLRKSMDSSARRSFDSVSGKKSIDLKEISEGVDPKAENDVAGTNSSPYSNEVSSTDGAAPSPPPTTTKSENSRVSTPEDDSDAHEFEDAKTEWKSQARKEESKTKQEQHDQHELRVPKLRSRQGSHSSFGTPEKQKPQEEELTEAQRILQRMKARSNSSELNNIGLNRSKSRSKQFKDKVDNDLDETIKMLEANMDGQE